MSNTRQPRLENGYGSILGFTHGYPHRYGYGYRIGQNSDTHTHTHTRGKVQNPVGKPLIPTTNPSFLQLGALDGPLSANQAEYLG